MGRLGGLALVVLAGLVLAGRIAAAAETESASDPLITIRHAGTLDTSWEPIMRLPDGRNFHQAHYEWALVWRGRRSQLEKSPTQQLTVETLEGTVKYTDRTSAEHADCTGAFRAKVRNITFTASINEGQGTIVVNVRVPASSEFLKPTNTTSLHEFCGEVVRWALPGNEMIPFFQLNLAKGGTAGRDVTVGPLAPNRDRAALEHSVSVTLGAGATAAANAKTVARNDLRIAVERAKGPCLHLAISLGVLTTGAVWTSVGAAVPGGIPAGGAVIATGDVMASAVAPLCASLIKQIVIDYSIYKRDPPVSRAAPALRLPSCTKWQGKVRSYCEDLGAAAAKLVAAEARVVTVLTQLQDAAAKLAASRKAGGAQAVKDAQARVNAVAASLRAARAATSAAGKQVATLVRAAGVQGKVSKAQSAVTIDALLSSVAKRGVPPADLRSVAPSALMPRPVDVLATLST